MTLLFNLQGMYVEDPKEDELRQQCPQTSKSKQILQWPENYQTCMNYQAINLLRLPISFLSYRSFYCVINMKLATL